eukprot:GEMP01013127.1.p1 GENE.GEMP01013127.1~~GEMP01013127.1.p1  ORF type:complete len:790 (+),score=204.80 GEMP01013127.1:153-2522(+)
MTGVIEGVVLAGGALKLIERYQGSEELRLAQHACVRELFAKYLSKDFHSEDLNPQSMRVTLKAGANQHISAAFHHLDQYLQEKQQRILDFFRKDNTLGIRESVALYFKKWLSAISAEEDSLDPKEVTRHLDFARQILMRADLFHSTETNSFLRSLAFTCEQLEKVADHLYGANRTASRVLDRICHAGRETVQLMIPIMLFSILTIVPRQTKQTHFDSVTLLQTRQTCDDDQNAQAQDDDSTENFRKFWATPVGAALYAVLNSPHCIDLMGWRTQPVAEYELNVDMIRPHALGFSDEVLDQYVDLFRHLDTFVYFIRVLQLYQNLAAASGDVLMCYLYATLNHLLHEIEVALVALHQVGAKLLGAGKAQLQSLLRRSKALSEEQMSWVCRLRHIDEESLGANHRCLFDLFCELRQLSALDRLPSIQHTIARNVRSLRDAFHSNAFQARASLPLEGTAMQVLENVLNRVAAVEGVPADHAAAVEDLTSGGRQAAIKDAEPVAVITAVDNVGDLLDYDDNAYAYEELNTYGVFNTGPPVEECRTPPVEEHKTSPKRATTEPLGANPSLKWIERALAAEHRKDSPALSTPSSSPARLAPSVHFTPSSSSTSRSPARHPASTSVATSVATTTFLPEVLTAKLIEKVVATTTQAQKDTPNLLTLMGNTWKNAMTSSSPRIRVEPFPTEQPFYDALWSIMSPRGDPIPRSDVARLVGGAVLLGALERLAHTSSDGGMSENLQEWTFAHLTVVLRALGHMQQNEAVALDEPPAVLPKVEGYMWDVERGRLRMEWPTL